MNVSVYRTLENVPRVRFNRDLGLLGYFNQDVGGSFVINICSKKVIFNLVLIGRANFIVVFDNFLVQVNLCQMLFFLQNMGRTCCVQKLFWMSETITVHNMFSTCSAKERDQRPLNQALYVLQTYFRISL